MLVRRDLERVFDYRYRAIESRFLWPALAGKTGRADFSDCAGAPALL